VSPNETKSETAQPAPKRKAAKRAPATQPEQPTRIIIDADEEFEGFKEDVEAWKGEFLPDELRPLLESVKEYVDEILASLPKPELEEVGAV
jgi:hypothetical protein